MFIAILALLPRKLPQRALQHLVPMNSGRTIWCPDLLMICAVELNLFLFFDFKVFHLF